MNDQAQSAALLSSGVGLWDWDLADELRFSPQLEIALGLLPREFPGTKEAFLALLYPQDRSRVTAALEAARNGATSFSTEFRIVGVDGQFRWYAAQAEILRGSAEISRRLAGTIQEVGATIVTERRMRRQQSALLSLVTRAGIRDMPLEEAFAIVVAIAAETLEVSWAGIWLFDAQGARIDCISYYHNARDRQAAALSLHRDKYPRYFDTLRECRALAIADVRTDPRTAELVADYLVPLDIASMLDAAIRGPGGNAGVICHEHTGLQRTWLLDEQSFAASVADFIAELLEAEARRKAEHALRRSEEGYRAFIEQSTEAIWRVDMVSPVPTSLPPAELLNRLAAQGRLAEGNRALVSLLGFADDAGIVGRKIMELGGETNTRGLLDLWHHADYRLRDHELLVRFGAGKPRWISISMTGVIEDGAWVRLWGVMRDVTERREAAAAIEYQSRHDALTGLPNRAHFAQDVKQAITNAAQAQQQLALYVIDLDHFKEINDTLGHSIGDELLGQLGPRLVALLPQASGTIARMGGDEFAVLLREVDGVAQAGALAARIISAIREPFMISGSRLEIGASVGVALYPDDGADEAALLRCADIAMYQSKKARTGFALYRADANVHTIRRLDLLSDLGTAIRERQLLLHYQPKVDLKTGRVCGLEALCRWPHARHGMVPPDEFIELAEMGDLIRPLTLLVLDLTLAQWKQWATRAVEGQPFALPIAINLSARSLVDDAIVADVSAALKRHGVPAAMLELEITESVFLLDADCAMAVLGRLRALGLTLSIDDFGTGFSSLTYLSRMPISALKIDKSLVLGMSGNDAGQTIVKSTIQLAHNLGLTVVAEGVETDVLREALAALGCDMAQGYGIARPMAADLVPSAV